MMDQIPGTMQGVIGIADDVVIYGDDDEDHDQNLHTSCAEPENMVLCLMERNVKSRRTQ